MTFRDFLCEFDNVFICRVFKGEAFQRQVVATSWASGPRQAFSMLVDAGQGPVCLQLQQADARSAQVSGSPIHLEVATAAVPQTNRAFPGVGASPFRIDASGRGSWRTAITPQREVAIEVDVRKGRYDVFAEIHGQAVGDCALIIFSLKKMRVSVVPVSEQTQWPEGERERAPVWSGAPQSTQAPPRQVAWWAQAPVQDDVAFGLDSPALGPGTPLVTPGHQGSNSFGWGVLQPDQVSWQCDQDSWQGAQGPGQCIQVQNMSPQHHVEMTDLSACGPPRSLGADFGI